ncbi:hypothetical protein F4678DRAFT_437431 [Xylaria arbuscula]|nr:hypothetical protein F4678DRAFT_437431 [Xylaria arbuscula]
MLAILHLPFLLSLHAPGSNICLRFFVCRFFSAVTHQVQGNARRCNAPPSDRPLQGLPMCGMSWANVYKMGIPRAGV